MVPGRASSICAEQNSGPFRYLEHAQARTVVNRGEPRIAALRWRTLALAAAALLRRQLPGMLPRPDDATIRLATIPGVNLLYPRRLTHL